MAENEHPEDHSNRVTVVSVPGRLAATVERTDAGEVRCRLRGDVDLAGLEALRPVLDEIVASDVSRLVVDLWEVDFFDSSGLNLLLRLRLEAEAAGVELELASLSPAAARVFELTGADEVFTIQQTGSPDGARGPK